MKASKSSKFLALSLSLIYLLAGFSVANAQEYDDMYFNKSDRKTVKVKNATIEGRLDGNIEAAEKIELKQNAQLLGDLQAKTLVIEEGVVFVGQCNVNPNGTKTEKQNVERQNIKVIKNI